jgi:hypothetical protein
MPAISMIEARSWASISSPTRESEPGSANLTI